MRYKPQNLIPEQLLERLGFTSTTRGYERYLTRQELKTSRHGRVQGRIHALIEGDEINIHQDRNVDGKHITKRFSRAVKKITEMLEELDLSTGTLINQV